MATLAENNVKQSALLNQLVLDFDTTEIVGQVKKLWLDLKSQQAKGLTCARRVLGREQHMFSWDKVFTVSHESILVNTESQGQVEQPESTNDVTGLQVWTDEWNRVGKLVDYCIDITTDVMADYLFISNGLRGIANGIHTLSPDVIITVGGQRINVAKTGIQNAQQYAEGLNEKIQHAKEFIHNDIAKSQEDFGLQTKTRHVAEIAREKLSDAAKRFQDETRELSAQARNKSARSKVKNTEDPDDSQENVV